MSLERYGLTSPPFRGHGEGLFVAVPSRSAPRERLEQALVDGSGIAVLSAAAGLGKTTLCRELRRRLQDEWLVALLQDCGCTTRRSLLQAILYELGLPYTGLSEQEARLRMFDAIRDRQPAKGGLMLLVDEAQQLNDRLLEELKSLFNHTVEGRPLVRVLLCGDGVLEERLIAPALAGVHQRVVCHETLAPLSFEESARIIDQRIQQAGGDGWEHVFTRTAMELLCLVCDGSPRNLDHLARRSLQIAEHAREPQVSVESVRIGLNELKELPLQWNEPSNLDAYAQREALETGSGDIVDWRTQLADDDDSVAVCVGDELPAGAVAVYEPAGVVEFGGESSDPVADAGDESLDDLFTRAGADDSANVLLDESTPSGLAETAVIEYGADPSEDEAEEAVATPSWEQETIIMRGTEATLTTEPQKADAAGPAWIELEVDDRYAILDADAPLPPIWTLPLHPAAVADDDAAPTSDAAACGPDEIESELLRTLEELHSDVRAEINAAAAESPSTEERAAGRSDAPSKLDDSPWCSGFSSMPEWDVVQPQWVANEPFDPVEVDYSRNLGDAIENVDAAPSEEAAWDQVEASAPPAAPYVEAEAVDASEPIPEPTVCQPDDRRLRVDSESEHRPYSKLFSRLRRLRLRVKTSVSE